MGLHVDLVEEDNQWQLRLVHDTVRMGPRGRQLSKRSEDCAESRDEGGGNDGGDDTPRAVKVATCRRRAC